MLRAFRNANESVLEACWGAIKSSPPCSLAEFSLRGLAASTKQAVTQTRSDGTAPRFYKKVDVGPVQGKDYGYTVMLDGRPLKSAAGRPLVLPNRYLALAVAAEWEWQDSRRIQPATMPMMTLTATAIDQPKPRAKVIKELLGYIDTDVVVCRDDPGTELAIRQEQAYKPLVAWANSFFGIQLLPSTSIFGSNQAESTTSQIHEYLTGLDNWKLGLADAMVCGCRSLVIGLALLNNKITVKEAMSISRLEEELQIEHWGLVEGAHDLDIADMKMKLAAATMFMRGLRM
ncbi:hypothetical protein BSKO_04576 [Bryopsis sp. KO-2023]|nr:hypothetical protein BSKO_04576 [Bryopsis sp. KO-2023]